jgi:GGDEF domain-containing protein
VVTLYPAGLTISAVTGQTRPSVLRGLVHRHLQRKLAEEEIRNLAFYDPLTRLPNRRLLLDRLRQALLASGRHAQVGALMFIDLDNFKTLNDSWATTRATCCWRPWRTGSPPPWAQDTGGLGGDEFVIMMEGLSCTAVTGTRWPKRFDTFKVQRLAVCAPLHRQHRHCPVHAPNRTVDELVPRRPGHVPGQGGRPQCAALFDPQMQAAAMARRTGKRFARGRPTSAAALPASGGQQGRVMAPRRGKAAPGARHVGPLELSRRLKTPD